LREHNFYANDNGSIEIISILKAAGAKELDREILKSESNEHQEHARF